MNKELLKVVHIIPNLKKGGAERLVIDICNELSKKKNIEVMLITLHPENDYQNLTKNIKIVTCSSKIIPSLTKKWVIDIDEYKKIISEFKPNVIHSHLFEAEFLSRYQTFPDVVYFTHFHDNMYQFKNITPGKILSKRAFTARYEKQILLKKYKAINNQFIGISNDTLHYIISSLKGINRNRIHKLPNAIDTTRFHSSSVKKINQPIKLISIGSLVAKKGHGFLLEVAKILKNKNYNFVLNIYGEGPLKEDLNRTIQGFELTKHVFLKGHTENPELELNNSHLYLHGATEEPFGLVLLEAMACGLPVISTNGGGNKDIVKNNIVGFLIENRTPNEFTNKIIEIINNKSLYDTMSNNCITAAKSYDLKTYSEKIIELYQKSIMN